ncbi:ABC transporter ATP-binding protein [Aurantimonas sp. VKM B-3413]|uniref:ABC transporter ATP-binding protein n=1 Tax=Aurantimonas sp. VKM B-3413 TaxID=2779401 RepID=UPI001E54F7A1|nr:ABC transporter ATP-binding protein [Aurantimonas sp. VKM B-3413]MCB8836767.1 ABC transporter ATP-binding protein [Aurantimonas sp. VKM B-3413]
MTNEVLLGVEDLTIAFGSLTALEQVSLSVQKGERLALLGHNGAGKSTLFRAILGFLSPNAGTIRIAGAAPGSERARRAVSYLPEAVAFPKALTGSEVITYFARLKGEPPKKALELMEIVGIADASKRRVGTYSKGMRQRLGLAQALIGRPDLLLLDEPTSGLDPISRGEFYDFVDRVARQGAAVLLSSHSLTEVEAKTDRIAILSKGRLVAEGRLADLAGAAALPIKVRVRAKGADADALHAKIGGRRLNGRSVELDCGAGDKMAVLSRLAALGDVVADIDIDTPRLDDVYRHYSKPAAPGDAA